MQYQQVHYAPTMVQAINNPDGTVSLIQMDPNSTAVVTLPDGTQAQVRAVSAVRVCLSALTISNTYLLHLK